MIRLNRVFGIVLVLAFATVCASHAQAAYTLTISADRDVFTTNSTVPINITLTNTSQKALVVDSTNPYYNYSVEVREKGTGKLVQDTDLGRRIREEDESIITRNVATILRPGASVSEGLHVGELRQMSQPGEYTIVVLREAPGAMPPKPEDWPKGAKYATDGLYLPPSNSKNFDRGVIRSNEITVTVQ